MAEVLFSTLNAGIQPSTSPFDTAAMKLQKFYRGYHTHRLLCCSYCCAVFAAIFVLCECAGFLLIVNVLDLTKKKKHCARMGYEHGESWRKKILGLVLA
ncbi:hypothetical protein L1987_27822 [Smallanthus sonchifolius]|uniref:Uncharacterized protein n=1 Tax=Smallanthus sonchifolius TaxID=185202 RepID=A0ACB9ICP8_9ASTR|nr:hypothetical protein L1987_27822 [Smallanthus sonchifolius]